MIGNYTAEVVKRKWIEDFVDKSTGQVVSVDRYEKILDKGVLIDKENAMSLNFFLQSGDISEVVVSNQCRKGDLAINNHPYSFAVTISRREKYTEKNTKLLLMAESTDMATEIVKDFAELKYDGLFWIKEIKQVGSILLKDTLKKVDKSIEYLKERGLKSDIQCPRKSSLFRKETLDGKVSYIDVDRGYCFDIECPSNTFHGFGNKFIDEMFPITMPYNPSSKKYAVACREFLVDKSHGDFDTVEILYIKTPDGEKVEVNKYFTDGRNVGLETDDWTEVSKEKYDELCKKRIDKIEDKITNSFLWTLTSNSHSDKENELLEKRYNLLPNETRKKIYNELKQLVIKHIVEPQKFEYNTFNVEQALCRQNDYYKYELSKIEGLKEISEYLMNIYNLLK